MSDLAVRGSIWLALACFAAAQAGFRRRAGWAPATCWIGAALALAHFLGVFHWHHDWSHARAVAATAADTARVFGLDWGGGVWVNYAFFIVWVADAWRWTMRGTQAPVPAPSIGTWMLRAFYLVVIANGAIVFVAWPMKLAGTAVVFVLLWAWRPER